VFNVAAIALEDVLDVARLVVRLAASKPHSPPTSGTYRTVDGRRRVSPVRHSALQSPSILRAIRITLRKNGNGTGNQPAPPCEKKGLDPCHFGPGPEEIWALEDLEDSQAPMATLSE